MRVVILTVVLATVLGIDAKQSLRTKRNACTGVPDGTFVANDESCSNFFVCYNGEAVVQSCNRGSYFDRTETSCLPDIQNICPQAQRQCAVDGEFSPHPTECSLFYVCSDGELIEQSCLPGSYFDSTNLYCIPDAKNVCPQSECSENGTYSPHPTNCLMFYICYDGKLVEQSCKPGSYFDKTNLNCVPDTNNVCSVAQCTEEGEFVPHPTQCDLFYVCYNGALVEQTCGSGSYFDKTNLYCTPDSENICRPLTPSTEAPCTCVGGYTNGEFIANPDSCYSYYVCSGGELVEQNCGYGNYFNNENKVCEEDKNGSCWTNPVTESTTTTAATSSCSCPGGYEEGDLVGDSESCHSYFVCTQGELIAQSCGTGNYFDASMKACARDENGSCWPTTTSTTSTAPVPCQCAGGYEEGDLVGDSDSCHSYFVCTQGELIAQSCGTGNYFDASMKACARDENGSCWPTTTSTTTTAPVPCQCAGGYEEGDLVGDSDSCHSYFVCTQGELIAQSCGTGNYFDASMKACARDENGSCWPTTTSTTTTAPVPCQCAGGYEEGDLVGDSDSCHSYFVCTQGELIAQSCGTGNYFDASKKACARDENGSCWPTTTSTTTTAPAPCQCAGGYEEGNLVENSESCHSYFVCTQGELIAQSCGTGNYFDVSTKTCARDENGSCWPTTTSTTTTTLAPCQCAGGYEEGDLVANIDDCSSYFICTQGNLVKQDCGSGNYFDATSKNCVHDVNGICRTKCPGGYDDGDLVPNNDNCSSYFICTQGILVEQDCGSGNYFDATSKNCVHDVNGICRTKCPGGYDDGDLVANNDNCSSYFICTQGILVEQDCGSGNYFDATSKNCVHDVNGICRTKCPGGYEEGDLVANNDNCSSYFICTQGNLVEQDCGSGNYFDATSKNCVHDVNGICRTKCPGGYDDGDLVANNDNCSSYFLCIQGNLVEQDCGSGNYFDATSKNCVHDVNGICRTKCPGGYEEGDLVANNDNCSSYFICTQGNLVEQDCGSGNYFDATSKNCVHDVNGICRTKCPGGYDDGDLVANNDNCSSYFICTQGNLVEQDCGSGNYFDATSKNCVHDVNGICRTKCPGGYEEGDLVANNDNCSSYFICTQGNLVEQDCGSGNYFDATSKNCVHDVNGICRTKCPGGYDDGDLVANNDNCSSYFLCIQGNLVEQDCGSGYYFDKSSKNCVLDVNGVCRPRTCPGGYENNELIAYPGSCYKFYICFNGELLEKSCQQGNYFDPISKSCVVDETNACWPTSSTPSTTTISSTISTSSTTTSQTTPSTVTPSSTASTTTPSSESPSTTTPSTTTEVDCTCPGGYEDGELVSYPGICYKFYICFNGELVEESCHEGNYFDPISKSCVVDETGVCWPTSSTPFTTAPSTTTASSTPTPFTLSTLSTTTSSGIPSPSTPSSTTLSTPKSTTTPSSTTPFSITPSTETPSTTTPSSETSSTTTEATCTCPGGYEDGELVSYPGICYKFYICFNGELVEESCHEGNYFDPISKSCVVDDTGVCWPTISTPSTTTISSTISTSSTTTSQTTPSTVTPSSTASTTTPSSESPSTTTPSTTTEVDCTCPGGYEDGELVSYPGICYKFYICFNGELVEESCHEGNYFDPISKSCVVDETGVCWPTSSTPSTTTVSSTISTSSTTTSQTTPSTVTPSSTTSTTTPSSESSSTTTPSTTTEVDCTCPGGYEDGELVSYPGICYKFYICFNGELMEESCHEGNYFDPISKSCVVDETGVCWPTSSTPSTTTVSSTISTSSTTTSQTTPSTVTPSSTASTTTPSSESSSTTTPSTTTEVDCTCPGGYEDGELVSYPGICYKFYICFNGELMEESCHEGNYFDHISKSCVVDETGVCWPTSSTPSTTTVSSTISTSSTTTSQTTPSTVTPSSTASTTTPSSESSSTTTPSTTTEVDCTCPGGYEDGELVSYPGICYKFYICFNGELVEESCHEGNYFDPISKSCVVDETGVCWPTSSTPSTTAASTTTTSSTPTPFTLSTSSTTTSSGIPSPSTPSSTTLSTPKSTTTPFSTTPFSITPSTEIPSTTTPSSETSSTTTEATCTCPGGYEDGELVSYPGICYKFYICFNGELVEESCHEGNYFDPISKSCVVDETGVCWPTSSTPSTTTISSTISTSSTTTSQTTPSTVTPSSTASTTTPSSESSSTTTPSTTTEVDCTCPGGYEDGELVSYPGICYKFYICFNGELMEESCHEGNYFDPISKSCVVDETGVCWPTSSTPSTTTISSTISTSSTTTSQTTPSTVTPSSTASTTTPSSESSSTTTPSTTTEVDSTCPGGYEDGELVSYPGICYKFYICFNGELVEESCHEGNYFDPISKSCVVDETGVCWPTSSTPSTTAASTTTASSTPTPFTLSTLSTTTSSGMPSPSTPSSTTLSTPKSTTTPSSTTPFSITPSTETPSTTTPSSETSSTTTEATCTCPGGYEDGEFIPYPDNCYKFYICFNGELLEESCGQGNYFNSTSKSCVRDKTGVCWPMSSTPSTTTVSTTTVSTTAPTTKSSTSLPTTPTPTTPSSTTPSSTTPSTTTLSTTASSTTPSSETTSTATPSTTTKAPSTCPGGYYHGEFVPYPDSCYEFYICFDGELLVESCGQGNYFDPISKSCVRDKNGVCWPINPTPSTTTVSTTKASTTTPTTKSSTPLPKTPPSTTLSSTSPSSKMSSTTSLSPTIPSSTTASTANPSTSTSLTTPSSEAPSTMTPSTTTETPCTCPGDYEDGELIPYPGSCYKFYICFNGELLEESCYQGNYFDPISKACVLDETGLCWPINFTPPTTSTSKTTASTTTSTTTLSSSTSSTSLSTISPSTTLSSTTPTSTIPSSTSSLSTISSSTILASTTPSTAIPSTKTSSTTTPSTTPSSATASTTTVFTTTEIPCSCPGGYMEGEFIPHPDSCYLFNVCYQSELVEVSCGFGNYFDAATKSCVLDTTGICWSRTTSTSTTTSTASAPCTCSGGYEEGDFIASPESCYGFYICYQGELNEMSCGVGNYFDNSTKSCALDTAGICWPKITPSPTTAAPRVCPNGYQNGQIVSNPMACYMYYICIGGDLIEGDCGTGNYFNNASNVCEPDNGGCCWPLNPTVIPQPGPYVCPNGLEEGQLSSSTLSCYLYNICHNGQVLEGNCGTGNYFNNATKACEADTGGCCWPLNTPTEPQPPSYGCPNGVKEGQFIANPSSCYLYNICYNGQLLQGNCGTGNYFNNATNACEADTGGCCWPQSYGCSNGLQEGQFSSSPSACYLYNICHNGQLLQGNCGTGNYFNSATNTCEADTSGSCRPLNPNSPPQPPSYGCPNGVQEGQFIANPSSCYLYSICHNGQLLQGNCGTGNYFNSATNTCEADTSGSCWPLNPNSPPQPPSYGCANGVQEGQFIANPSSCYLYSICHNGQLLQGNCGTGNYFNNATNACEADTGGCCWPQSYGCSNGLQEGQFSSSPSACYLYNICHNGQLLQGNCGTGNYFNSATNTCEADTSGSCRPLNPNSPPQPPSYGCPNGVQDGQFIANPSSCYLYSICHNGQLLQGNCGTGNYFNSATNTCEADTSGSCRPLNPNSPPQPPSYGCPNGVQEGQFIANPSSCYLYSICHNGQLLQGNCGTGNYFNNATNACEADTGGCCWPQSYGCSNGLQEGQFSSSPSACYLYNICHNGQLLQGNCGTGNYFNSATNTCEADTSGSCRPLNPNSPPQPPSYGCPNGVQEGQFIANPSSCYLYSICHNGQLLQGNCGTGNYFNNATNACEADTGGCCWPQSYGCSNGLQEGQFSSSPSACYLYNICHNGQLLQGNCGTGNYFNSATNTCEADTSGSCWPLNPNSPPQPPSYGCPNGVQEGQFIANPSSCYLYSICHNGQLLQGNCGTGNYFNNATNACEADTGGCCWPQSYGCSNGLQEGQFSSSPSACYLYNICHNGQLLQGNCGTGNYFNSATNTCEADTSGSCRPLNPNSPPQPPSYGCPNGVQEGQFIANPSSCYLYNICYNGQLLQGNCGTGNYFNNATNACEADTGGCCWPQSCSNGLQEGQFSSSPSACYLYNICHNGQLLQGNCGTGNYFNSATNTCEADTSGSCRPLNPNSPPQPPSYGCPNGVQEGQFIANPSSCYLYNICYNGQLLQGNCGTGNYFNNATNACEADTGGCCWPQSYGCSNGLQEGQFSSSPSACYLYNICHNGQLLQGNCGTGNYFNSATNICEADTSGSCWPLNLPFPPQPPSYGCPNGLQEGQFIANPSSCYLYNICYNGQLMQGNCGTGNYFNSATNTCQPDTAGSCWTQSPSNLCPNGLQEGQFTASQSSCYLYNICHNGVLVEGNCGTGNYFNNVTNICEPDTGGCCWPSNAECPGGYASGDFVPDPSQCDKFFICYQGALVPQDCGVGYFFDIFNNYCTRDINGTCWAVPVPENTCDGVADGTFLANETFCDKYSVCYNNMKIGQECGIGNYFNSETLTCVRDTLGTCWKKVTNVCANAITGTFVQNPLNCQEFYVCYQNRAILQQCGDGNWFNPQLMICQPDLNATCINVCQGSNTSLTLPHPNCNQFYACANGLTTRVGNCPNGTNFDPTLGVCLTSAICEADLCVKSRDGDIYPVQNDLASFYSCEKQIPVKHSCPDGASFDQDRLICTPDTGRCIGQKNGFAVASYHNPNAYYVCKNNMAIFEQCPSYAIFDEKSGICVQAQRKRLANNKCATEPDGTMLPGDACNEYHLCLDGEDIAQNCGAYSSFNKNLGYCTLNLTCFNEVELCAKSSDTETFPDARHENTFIKCKRGLAVTEKCPKNMIYSHGIGYCVPKELAMSSDELVQLCENASDNTMAPALDCRKFYICVNNVAILQQCASDQHFGVMTGTCLPDVERQCWIRSETLRGSFFVKTVCHEGKIRAHPIDCDRYEICAYGVWTAELCPAHHLFDSTSQLCVPGDAGKMCPSARSVECSNDMPLRASENVCTDYYRCENNHWKAAKCPIGEFFSAKMAKCTSDASACARSSAIKSVGEKNCTGNETRADELNCGLFHVCHEGEWWYRYCEEGNYFNKSLAACTRNDGTCRSVSVAGPCRNGTVQKSDFDPCIIYHLCVDGNWTTQHCPDEHYFDETRKACMLDDGQRTCQNDIKNISSSCKDGDRRYQSSNCAAFEICSFGNWLSVACRSQFYFDTSLKICMPNRGECSANGLMRRDCVENTSRPKPGNCSEFYYCSRSKWQLESCMEGFQYNATIDKCIPQKSSCETNNMSNWMQDKCTGLKSGSSVAHESDCTKYYLCVDDLAVEAECTADRFYDNESKYCELNNGACPLKMLTDDIVCQGKLNGSHVQNPANCTTFYICTDTLKLLSYCPPEHYFNAEIRACQIDTGICNKPRLCDGNPSGRLPHETYCNIYYSCVRGISIPVACEEDHIFDPTTRNCIFDTGHRCIDGILVGNEICAPADDGSPIVDSDDCTKYVVCTNGLAQVYQCPPGKFFDSNMLKCMSDDGSCPFVDGPDLSNNNTIPPDPITCIGKHGYLMPDPEHCNEFYVCIYGNLRHERCFDGEFFDLNTYSCSAMADDEKCPTAGEITTMCVNSEETTSFADQADCRKYYQCNDGELQSKKCRNGESFDTLLGFCRQNDGTCLLENGQRVGACAGKHGKLAADSENCRGYFTCINGQKISEECDSGEYFVKATSRCEKDVNSTCRPVEGDFTNTTQLSCDGLTELVFYPNVIDGCKTFFQCVKGMPRVHKCPDDLLFNGKTGICDWKDYVECIDMSRHYQIDKECLNAINGTRYGSSEDNCDSYFICNDGKMSSFKCDQGHKYNVQLEKCDLAANVNCTMTA